MMPLNNSHFLPSASVDFEEQRCSSAVLMFILKTQPMFLLIFGFLANLCSFAVLMRPRLRRRPTFSYLAFLSLSNSLLSLLHASFTILGAYFGLALEDLPLFVFCRLLNRFAIDFLTHFSLYTLTAVDLDRIQTVTSRTAGTHRYSRTSGTRQHGCSQAFIRVCFVELAVAVILFLINAHWLLFYGYTARDPGTSQMITACTIPDLNHSTNEKSYTLNYHWYLTTILPYIELIFFNIFPFLISLLATIVILRHVSIKYSLLNNVNQSLKKSRRRMELHLSILLISLNCVFLLFTTPHNVLNVYMGQLQKRLGNKSESEDEICPISILQKSLDLLQQCYFMSTFFLYSLTNKRFREEFYELLQRNFFAICRTQRPENSSTATSAHHRRHRHHHHHHHSHDGVNKFNHLMPPSLPVTQTGYSLSDYFSHDDCEDDDDDGPSTSRGYDTSELRLSVNPPSLFN